MKSMIKLFTLAFVALFVVSCNNNDEYDMLNSLWRNVTQNEARIDDLEKWCSQANTNITSLQTIVEAMKNNETINSMTPIIQEGDTIGYVIDFGTNGPITIYDDSHPANAPQIGVKEYGGTYYWTLNGEWMLDADGNKLRVSGRDGAAGADGSDGQNGQDGADGQDGVTPQLKIEADYWWISYDNGNTWTQLGKAKGDKGDTGATGAAGADGQDGDSMFQSVTQDAANVYFTLADGTLITIAKGGGGADDGGYVFTITYMPNGGEGDVVVDTVYYGESYSIRGYLVYTKEGYYIGSWNTNSDGHGTDFYFGRTINAVSRNITLYAQWREEKVFGIENGYYYVVLGLPSGLRWATCNVGAANPEEYGDYYAWGETEPKTTYSWSTYKWHNGSSSTYTKYIPSDNKTVLDLKDDAATVKWGGVWRMPTDAEWRELLDNCTWTWTYDYNGTGVAGRIVTSNINGNSIFLPAAGCRYDAALSGAGSDGKYWSSSLGTSKGYAWHVCFYSDGVYRTDGSVNRTFGLSVRPVLGE